MTLVKKAELLPYKGSFYLWSYEPSKTAAAIFLVIFLITTAIHTWKMARYRMWFCLSFTLGGLLEIIGYAGRIAAAGKTNALMPYIVQSVFLLVPPALFAASIYMTLGRIIRARGPIGELCSLINPRWLTTLFVLGDIFSFLVQSTGAGLMSSGGGAKLGQYIVIAGLLVQLASFGLFIATVAVFNIRYRQYHVTAIAHGGGQSRRVVETHDSQVRDIPWRQMLWMLYATSTLIMVRSIFRVVEYAMGSGGYPLQHEWTMYVFDSALMSLTMVIFYTWYPSEVRTSQLMQPSGLNTYRYNENSKK